MAWDAAFVLVNLIAFGGWAALVLLPRLTSVSTLVLYLGVGLLCVAYTVTFVSVFGGLVDPHRLPGVPPPDLTDYSIAGLRPLFLSDAGILIGWTHYLAFDLFVGRWIADDADRKGYSRLARDSVPLCDAHGWPDRPPRLAHCAGQNARSKCEMSDRRFYEGPAGADSRRSAPAASRNREPIAQVLEDWLPERGLVLEIASGTGEHALFFAERFPGLDWQPSDSDPDSLNSIAAWRAEADLPNLREPIALDASAPDWPIEQADAVLSINMVHISPWRSALGLLDGAARLLSPGAPLILYGPWIADDIVTAPSNLAFDAELKRRNPEWGLRRVEDFAQAASKRGLELAQTVAMPANNFMLLLRRMKAPR